VTNPPQDSRPVDARSLAWLRRWMQLGADMSIAVEELRKQDFSDAAILAAIEQTRPRGNALDNGAMSSPPLIRRPPANLRRIESAGFPLYTLADFLNPLECVDLIAMSAGHLQRSPLTTAHYDSEFRTSTTANLYEIDDPRALAIDEKICRTLGIRASYSEGIQAQRYEIGQQFKPHWDGFEPGTKVYSRFAGVRGNRTWTFMVYLNDGMEGGATRFTEYGATIQPRAGMALLWNNLLDDGSMNKRTLHCGEPVTSGCKVIITKWFRVHGDGPVFHD
jgi:prolyl 4-hydroxylase